MSTQTAPEQAEIICAKCGIPLSKGKVVLSYLGSNFPVELYRCPQCGLVYIPEELAQGKMKEVEAALEDK